MKVIVNASNLTVGGGVQVAISYILTLGEFSNHDFLVLASDKIYNQLTSTKRGNNVELKNVNFGLKDAIKKSSKLSSIEAQFKPDVVFSVFGPSYWTPKAKHLMGFALPWLINPESKAFSLLSSKERIKKKIQNSIKKYYTKKNADFYVVETEDVKNRMHKFLGAKLKNTWVADNTYNQFFAEAEKPDRIKNEVFRFITISANYPHKNLSIIRDVADELKSRGVKAIFTLTIPDFDYENMFSKHKDVVKNLGPIPAANCPEQYSKHDALFLPTLLECFTASYPEAMVMKRPILTSDLGFAKAICGEENALFFDPLNAKDICDKIELLVNDDTKYNQLVGNGEKRVKEFQNRMQRAETYTQILEKLVSK